MPSSSLPQLSLQSAPEHASTKLAYPMRLVRTILRVLGVATMVTPAFENFFMASSAAAAALAGLLFVAVSLIPDSAAVRRTAADRQAVATSAFTALVNVFFISMAALIPDLNLGLAVVVMSSLSMLQTLLMGWSLVRGMPLPLPLVRRMVLVSLGAVVYSLEFVQGWGLLQAPEAEGHLFTLAIILLYVYGFGLTRAWELLGARQRGPLSWLSPLRNEEEDSARPTSPTAVGPTKARKDEAA